jgi:PKD repeat protein
VGGPGGTGSTLATDFFGPTAPSYGTPGPAPGRYFAGGGGGNAYINSGSAGVKWLFGDGKTSNLNVVTHRYQNPGIYDVKLILTNILNGCKDSTTIPVNIETSSLSSVKILPSFQYYPNPSNGFVKIVCSEISEGPKMMQLLNTSGQVVMSKWLDFVNGASIIDLNGLSSGLYLLKLEGYQSVVIAKQE